MNSIKQILIIIIIIFVVGIFSACQQKRPSFNDWDSYRRNEGLYPGLALTDLVNPKKISASRIYEIIDGKEELIIETEYENGLVVKIIHNYNDKQEERFYYKNKQLTKVEYFQDDVLFSTLYYKYENKNCIRNIYSNNNLMKREKISPDEYSYTEQQLYPDVCLIDKFSIQFNKKGQLLTYNEMGLYHNCIYEENLLSKVIVSSDKKMNHKIMEYDYSYDNGLVNQIDYYDFDSDNNKNLLYTVIYSNFDEYGNWSNYTRLIQGKEVISYRKEITYN